MQKLNLRAPKTYDMSGISETQTPRIHYYCVSEGPTEESYFYGIRNNRAELNIKNDVYIHVVEKEEDWEKYCKWEDYDPEIDQVCVIFDRDYRDLEKHLKKIYELCEKHKINVVMSNPNFELWLLMHFPNIKQYDRKKLLENKKNLRHEVDENASKSKKYLVILVAKSANGYSKGSKIHFERFLPLIDDAINQAKLYCEDSQLLENELGTSVGKLIRQMRK